MAKTIGRNTNTNDTATLSSGISVGSSTSIKVADANPNRISIIVTVKNKASWIKLQAASVDNDKKGIFVNKDGFYEMTADNIYTGEICVISDISTATIYVTEY